jgi:hypothetical protein
MPSLCHGTARFLPETGMQIARVVSVTTAKLCLSSAIRRSFWACLCLAPFASGCVSGQAFMPVANVSALSPDGKERASEYPVEINHQRVGTARVWTNGAYRTEVQGSTRTVVHVGFALDNTSSAPLSLDPKQLRLQDVLTPDGALYQIPPVQVDGNLTVAPAHNEQMNAVFELPGGIWPSDVLAYHVAWKVEAGGTFAENTPFVGPGYGRYPYSPYYYAYPYDYYWGYPWGYWWPGLYYSPYHFYPYRGYGGFAPRGYVVPRHYASPRAR